MPTAVSLVLASASPRRAELLRAAAIPFEVCAADVDESLLAGETPEVYVRRLADAKADAVAALGETRPILGADTVVVVDGRMLGKPCDAADARAMVQALAGRTHMVFTGVCVIGPAGSVGPGLRDAGVGPVLRPRRTGLCRTLVEMAAIDDAELDWYVASREPMDKAGAYAIQGRASRYVTRIEGSYANVVGLPVSLVHAMCRDLGILVS